MNRLSSAQAAVGIADSRVVAHLAISGRADFGGGGPGVALTPSVNARLGGDWVRFVAGVGARVDTRRDVSSIARIGVIAAMGRGPWTLETTLVTGGYRFGTRAVSELYIGAGRSVALSR